MSYWRFGESIPGIPHAEVKHLQTCKSIKVDSPPVDPKKQIRYLISVDNQEKRAMMMSGNQLSLSRLKKPSKRKKSLMAGGSIGPAAGFGSKFTKIISPKHHVRKLRDAYVAFMLNLAGSKRMSLVGSTGVSAGWPCMTQPLKYPGRQPREEKLVEELECANVAQAQMAEVAVPQRVLKPPPCTKKAIFPL